MQFGIRIGSGTHQMDFSKAKAKNKGIENEPKQTRGVCVSHTVALAFTLLESILRQKRRPMKTQQIFQYAKT
jgi:hypothetical protein